jgi:hypothetical protein
MDVKEFRIIYLRPQRVNNVFTKLLNFANIRRNVDEFFLHVTNYPLIAESIHNNKAIAYVVTAGKEYVGCLMAFRDKEKLFAHFLFRIYPALSVTDMALTIIPLMVRHFDRKGIYISKVIGRVPLWNKAAIRVCLNVEAVDNGIIDVVSNENGKIIRCKELIYEVPPEMHIKSKYRNRCEETHKLSHPRTACWTPNN